MHRLQSITLGEGEKTSLPSLLAGLAGLAHRYAGHDEIHLSFEETAIRVDLSNDPQFEAVASRIEEFLQERDAETVRVIPRGWGKELDTGRGTRAKASA